MEDSGGVVTEIFVGVTSEGDSVREITVEADVWNAIAGVAYFVVVWAVLDGVEGAQHVAVATLESELLARAIAGQ